MLPTLCCMSGCQWRHYLIPSKRRLFGSPVAAQPSAHASVALKYQLFWRPTSQSRQRRSDRRDQLVLRARKRKTANADSEQKKQPNPSGEAAEPGAESGDAGTAQETAQAGPKPNPYLLAEDINARLSIYDAPKQDAPPEPRFQFKSGLGYSMDTKLEEAIERWRQQYAHRVFEKHKVSDITKKLPEKKEGPKVTLLSDEEASQISAERQAYQSFDMDGLELLVLEDREGRLHLTQSFVFDKESNAFIRPAITGELPSQAAEYQVVPWYRENTGDEVKNKKAYKKLLKVIFVEVASSKPYKLNLRNTFIFDAHSRTLSKPPIEGEDKELLDPVLRVTPDGVFLQESDNLPDVAILREYAMARAHGGIETEEQREAFLEELQELENANARDDYKDFPDVPPIDLI